VRRDDLNAVVRVEFQLQHAADRRPSRAQLDAAPALEQAAVRERDRPPALWHARHARVADAQHEVGAVHAQVAPALERAAGSQGPHAIRR